MSVRNQLFDYYSKWSRHVAGKLYTKYAGTGLEWADFSQFCALGLLIAIDRFELERGTPFKGFAYPYMVGRTLDGLQCFFNEKSMGANTAGTERLETFELPEGNFESIVDAVVGLAFGYFLETGVRHEELPANSAQEFFFHTETLSCIKNIVESLEEPERGVIKAHYFQSMKFSEIAGLLELSPSRISQIHSKGLKNIRSKYENLFD